MGKVRGTRIYVNRWTAGQLAQFIPVPLDFSFPFSREEEGWWFRAGKGVSETGRPHLQYAIRPAYSGRPAGLARSAWRFLHVGVGRLLLDHRVGREEQPVGLSGRSATITLASSTEESQMFALR